MPDERIDKALKDPSFLALAPDDQVAVLQHYKDNPVAAVAAPATDTTGMGIGPPPQVDEGTATKLARGAELGVAKGLGIPESTDPGEVASGAVKNAAGGYANVAKSVVGFVAPPKLNTEEGVASALLGPLGPTALNVGRGIASAGADAWKGLRDKDPEAFANGFGNMATQVLTLAALRKGKIGDSKIDPAMRQARVATAIDAGPVEHANLEKAMSKIVPQAQAAGIHSVADLGKVIRDAHTQVNNEFNQAFYKPAFDVTTQQVIPLADHTLIPTDVSRAIMKEIKPHMSQTPEGVAAAKMIRDRALQYQKDWSLEQLNEQRMELDKRLTAHYKKDSMGQFADPVQLEVAQAERSAIADTVYGRIEKANPGLDVTTLKRQHGALWQLDDAINGDKGAVNDLKAQQGVFKAQGGRMGQLRGGMNISKSGPHGYLANVVDAMFGGGGPMQRASAMTRKAFNPTLSQRAARLGALGFPAAHQLSPPPQVDDADAQQ